ncbi:MAG: D-alanyl-D-alanine carboxypeptidase [Bacillaceae bacterium]|nr:D-alanyl-D-alanine carboxypeptidase [Bacillaceae bacterium]
MDLKKTVITLFIIVILLQPNNFVMADGEEPPEISARAAAMIDVESGRILYDKNADQPLPIASITKIMTAIVALEQADPEETVVVPRIAEGVEGSSIYIKTGEKYKLLDLLYGLMLRSGNDAAVAIAYHVGGSVDGFVFLMNRKAEELGMKNTHFVNPHGLHDDEHYSSARDMAILTSYALKNPLFQEIVKTRVKHIDWPGQDWDRRLINKNKMLKYYKGADGVKTGYTRKAKRTLVSSATRNGVQLATVTLNDPDDWNDSMNLLDWGFETFEHVGIVDRDIPVEELNIRNKNETLALYPLNPFRYPLKEGEKDLVSTRIIWNENVKKHRVHEGEIVGHIKIYLDQEQIGSIGLKARWEEPAVSDLSASASFPFDYYLKMFWEMWFGGI